MARYCFYCGKQLKDGEKCNCRTQSYYSAPGHADTNYEQNSRPKEENKNNSSASGNYAAGKSYSDNSQSQTQKNKEDNRYTRRKPFFYRDNSQRRRHKARKLPSLSGLVSITGWVRTPSDKIREQALNNEKKVPTVAITVNLLILMLWFSLFYYRISLQFINLNENVTGPKISHLLLYSLGISLLLCFLESFFIWILLRLMERLQITLIDILRLSRAAYTYLTLFVVLAIGTVITVPLASLAMIICGFMFAIYVHIRSLCYVYSINGNSQIRLMAFTMIFFAASFTFVGQLIPVLITTSPTIPTGTIS